MGWSGRKNASAQDIWDAAAFGVGLSWQRDVLCEKIDLTNLAALPVGLELRKSEGYDDFMKSPLR